MELTKEILEQYGFESSHPDYKLCKYKKKSKEDSEWFISVESEYVPMTNDLMWNVNCWKTNDKGVINKRAQVGYINTVEDLELILELCGLKLSY